MIVLDTNVLIYAADRDSEFHTACSDFVVQRAADVSPTYLTWNICYEFLRVVTHPRVFKNPWTAVEAFVFIDYLLQIDSFAILNARERHANVLNLTVTELPDIRGNLVHDLHTAVLMRQHGITQICTRDTDFHRFPFVTVLDPVRLAR